MSRAVILACWPWLVVLMALVLSAYGMVRLSDARPRLGRLRRLHGDQAGSVQSLSFVLTLPIFLMFIMMIVQVSQLMIGLIVVHYAAYAAARSAAVWIPAELPGELANCIGFGPIEPDPNATNEFPILDPTNPAYGPTTGGVTYIVCSQPPSPKYNKIASAAILACMPVSPSRDLGLSAPGDAAADEVIKSVYSSVAPSSRSNGAVPGRLDNKLAYAWNNTTVQIRFFHSNEEPPLEPYFLAYDPSEFRFNELGWQDQITVTVNYNLALLPGPGRLLAKYVTGPGGAPDKVAQSITNQGSYYTYPLTASISMGNEGEKPMIPYEYQAN